MDSFIFYHTFVLVQKRISRIAFGVTVTVLENMQAVFMAKPIGQADGGGIHRTLLKTPKLVVHSIFLLPGAISVMQPKYGRQSPLVY